MSIKLPLTDPPFDLNALLGISDTNVVSTTEGVSSTNAVNTTPVVSTTKPGIVSTTPVVNTTEGVVSTTAPEARTKYINEWKKKNRKRLQIEFPAEQAEALKAEAARRGMSLTAMVKAALMEYLERRPAE